MIKIAQLAVGLSSLLVYVTYCIRNCIKKWSILYMENPIHLTFSLPYQNSNVLFLATPYPRNKMKIGLRRNSPKSWGDSSEWKGQ